MSTHARRRMPVTVVGIAATVCLVAAGCGRSSSGAPSGNKTSAAPPATASASATSSAGDFGTLKSVCGPGTAKPAAAARGLTDSTIRLGVMSDTGAAAAPGIEQEFFDASDAFTKWCNALGGVDGRKLVIDKWDAKLFNSAAVTVAACQKDFMLVGGGAALDDAAVKPRLACKLGAISAYTVSTAAANAGLQVKIHPGVATQIPFGGYRLLTETYPDMKKGIAVGSATLASLLEGGKKQKYALDKAGYKVTALQDKPVLVDNFRPYMEALKGSGTVALYETSGQDITPEIQAIKNIGWNPQALIYSYQFYTAQNVAAAKALKTFPNIYINLDYLPFEVGDAVPAIKEIKSQLSAAVAVPKYDQFTLESYSAWLLFVTAAKSCSDNLNQDCVLKEAGSHTDWTAGGISPPVSTSPDATSITDCTALIRLTTNGWVYDKAVTRPNNGYFNCDPANIATVPANP